MKLQSTILALFLLLGVMLGHSWPSLSLAPWIGDQSQSVLLEESERDHIRSAMEQGIASEQVPEILRHQELLTAFQAANSLGPLRWILWGMALIAALLLACGGQIRELGEARLSEARAAHTFHSITWVFLPWGLFGSLLAAAAGLGLALLWPSHLEASNAHFALDAGGYGVRGAHSISILLALGVFFVPVPQALRQWHRLVKRLSGPHFGIALLVAGGFLACYFGLSIAPLITETSADLLPLGAILVALVLGLVLLAFLRRVKLWPLLYLSPYKGLSASSDAERRFWLLRGVRVFRAALCAYLVTSCVLASGGDLILRVALIIAIAATLLSLFAGGALLVIGLAWAFFAKGAGFDVRYAATLAEWGALPLILATLADHALVGLFEGRDQEKPEKKPSEKVRSGR